jgi:protein TonB
MTTRSGLHPVYKPKDASRRYKGIAIVVALHILIGWAIVSGTAKNALVALKKPLEAVVIQEVIIPPPPPPPPPPPKEIKPKEVPKVEAPPPPFVPPPDVAPPATLTAPVVQAVATPPPTPAVIAPPPPPAPPAPPAPPPPPAPPKPAPNRSDIRVACPTQVQPEMPRRAIQNGIGGVVRAQVLIKEGVVKEVTILSGPSVFHAAVRAAMLQYKCTAESGEITATQEFVFKNE